MVEESEEKDGTTNEFIFSFKNEQEAESSNPSDKFAYLGQVEQVKTDPSSCVNYNLPLGVIEEDAQEIYGSISSQLIRRTNASFKKSSDGGLTSRQTAEIYTPEGTINNSN